MTLAAPTLTHRADPFAHQENGQEPSAPGALVRRILASSARARAHWKSKSPGVIVFRNKADELPVRAKTVIDHDGTLPATWRRIKVPIHVEQLSAAARAIVLAAPEPDNRQRSCDYRFDTGLTFQQVFAPDAESEQCWGRPFWQQPFMWTLHWPQLHDEESGEAYYERCALLVELNRALLAQGVPPGEIAGLVAAAERFAGDGPLKPLVVQLLERWQRHRSRPSRKGGRG